MIANKLKKVFPLVISVEESGFSPNRSIFEGVIVIHEAIHSVRMAKVEKFMVKLDIKRAYDEVNRSFLLKVLEKFGFYSEWVS